MVNARRASKAGQTDARYDTRYDEPLCLQSTSTDCSYGSTKDMDYLHTSTKKEDIIVYLTRRSNQ